MFYQWNHLPQLLGPVWSSAIEPYWTLTKQYKTVLLSPYSQNFRQRIPFGPGQLSDAWEPLCPHLLSWPLALQAEKRWKKQIMETRPQRGNYNRPNSKYAVLKVIGGGFTLCGNCKLHSRQHHTELSFPSLFFQKVNGCRISCLPESYQQLGQALGPWMWPCCWSLHQPWMIGWWLLHSMTQWKRRLCTNPSDVKKMYVVSCMLGDIIWYYHMWVCVSVVRVMCMHVRRASFLQRQKTHDDKSILTVCNLWCVPNLVSEEKLFLFLSHLQICSDSETRIIGKDFLHFSVQFLSDDMRSWAQGLLMSENDTQNTDWSNNRFQSDLSGQLFTSYYPERK